MSKEEAEAWREIAVGTIRNLSSLVESAQSMLREAQNVLDELERKRDG
jgi:hypothetical protein